MKRVMLAGAMIATALSVATPASAARGVVVMNQSGCGDRFVVQSQRGFAILEWYGGYDPQEGDQIVGNFESYGMKDVENQNEQQTHVWVEDFWLSKSSVIEKMESFCQ